MIEKSLLRVLSPFGIERAPEWDFNLAKILNAREKGASPGADRKFSLGNLARPIDFRSGNDQYTGRGWQKYSLFRGDTTRACSCASVGRPAGARVLAGRCAIVLPQRRLRPLCFRRSLAPVHPVLSFSSALVTRACAARFDVCFARNISAPTHSVREYARAEWYAEATTELYLRHAVSM